MKKAHIEVTVTYTAHIIKEIDDDMYANIEEAQCEELDCYEQGCKSHVFDFLSDNVKEQDAGSWTVEVDDIYEEDE